MDCTIVVQIHAEQAHNGHGPSVHLQKPGQEQMRLNDQHCKLVQPRLHGLQEVFNPWWTAHKHHRLRVHLHGA
jgi:hypothetical protein